METPASKGTPEVDPMPADARPGGESADTVSALRARLSAAVAQQTAMSEILRVISASPTNVQPVLDAVSERAALLCDAPFARIFLADGEVLRPSAEYRSASEADYPPPRPIPLLRTSFSGRAVVEGVTLHHADVVPLLETEYPAARENARAAGIRAVLAVPLMREAGAYGAIFLWRRTAGSFTPEQVSLVETFAQQVSIAVDNVRLFKETKDALEQQTATSEILRVISSSPTDVQPVFDVIGARAEKLCDAEISCISNVVGELIHLASLHQVTSAGTDAVQRLFPMQRSAETVTARTIRSGAVVHLFDVLADPSYGTKGAARAGGFRGALGVPMIRKGQVIGAIFVARTRPGYFTETQVNLLKTFADQAVIAVENVRLFTTLRERNHALSVALDQQTATSDILRVISNAQTDVQPVFDAIVASAVRLCGADHSVAARFDGELLHPLAFHGFSPEALSIAERMFPMRPSMENMLGRTALKRTVDNLPDMLADPYYSRDFAQAGGWRSGLGVPMFRDGKLIGAIAVSRREPGVFSDLLVTLMQTFADQAVIAIENVRLFTELQVRNSALTEALEQQTATSDILGVISRSQTDVQPVFEIIAAAAQKLCGAGSGNVFTFDGELIHVGALVNVNPRGVEAMRRLFPRPPSRDLAATRAILTCSVVAIPDVLEDPDIEASAVIIAGGFRSILAVPLVRDGNPIGAIAVGRPYAGSFTDAQIGLLQTFANQAVIAIENVRLFKTLEARTTELTQSVGELRALGEIGQAVSSTLDLETVLGTIVSRATELSGTDGGAIYEYDAAREDFCLHTAHRLPAELVDALRSAHIRKGEGALGRLAVVGEPVQVRDIVDERSYQSRVRKILIRCGYRSLLAVPLLCEGHLLGGLVVNRNSAGEFTPQVIELLKSFATQSALAIQNARLFREIEVKSRELEAASRHKSEFLSNMSHELRTPLNAIIGFSEVLSEQMFGTVNDKQAEYLRDILESGRHLLSLINDILDLSKIEAGRMELDRSDVCLPNVIDNALILVRERATRHGIALDRTLDERVDTISADERKVKQVLLNLLSNALKFTPEGGRIDVCARIENGGVAVSVTDTGVGIAPQDQAAVFEEFRQVGATARKVEGTGLGLAISRKFIELHGGRLWVDSAVGKGSTFTFTLPLP